MRYIELFAGIGGFRYGLESTNRNKDRGGQEDKAGNKRQGLQPKKGEKASTEDRRPDEQPYGKPDQRTFTCVYSNEWDKYASQVYKKHYGEIDTRDITTVKAEEIPDHDLLCAGFPCQAFSIAGRRKGFDDTRGTLFFDIARIASEKRPRYLLLENVKGLLSHDKGKTFSTILGVLSDLGYECEWQVLNSKHFGVPQNRERVFIVGHLGGRSGRKVFPLGETNGSDLASTAIDANYWKGIDNHGARTGISHTQERGSKSDSPNRIRRTAYTDGARIRRLTPTECARLQGFPDDWHEGLSDTQAYKCYGNAVTTNVVEAIGTKLLNITA